MQKMQEKRYVGVKENTIYGFANAGQVFGYNIVTSYLSFFFVTVFEIPPAAVATMILFVGIWDTINDPIMGGIIDRTRTRYGKLRPYLLFVPIPLAITTILLFSGPVILGDTRATVIKIIYMYISYLLWEFFYTIGDVPFWGMSAAISPNPNDRTRAITSARFISGIVGGLAGPLLSVLIDLSNNQVIGWDLKQVFCFMGILSGVGGMALFSLAGIFTRERVVQSAEEPGLFASFKYLGSNKPLALIIVANLLNTLSRVASVFGNYYYITVLGYASLSFLAGLPGIIFGFIAYAFIPKLRKRFNCKQIIFLNAFVRVAVIAVAFLLGMNNYMNPAIIIPILAVQGIFVSITDSINMVIPTEMIGDTVDYMEWKTGKRNEGMSFAVLTFVSKFSSSVSLSIGTAILPLIGITIVSGNIIKGGNGINTDFWLWAFYTIIPAALGLLQLIPYIFYDLVGEKQQLIHKEMKIRREALSKEVSSREAGEEKEE